MDVAVPFPRKDRARQQFAPPLVEGICQRRSVSDRADPIFFSSRSVAASRSPKRLGLETVGDHRKQQLPGQVRGRLPSGHALPAGPQTIERETAQMRDLLVQCAVAVGSGQPILTVAWGSGRWLCLGVNRMIVDPIDAAALSGCRKSDRGRASCEQRQRGSLAPNAAASPLHGPSPRWLRRLALAASQ